MGTTAGLTKRSSTSFCSHRGETTGTPLTDLSPGRSCCDSSTSSQLELMPLLDKMRANPDSSPFRYLCRFPIDDFTAKVAPHSAVIEHTNRASSQSPRSERTCRSPLPLVWPGWRTTIAVLPRTAWLALLGSVRPNRRRLAWTALRGRDVEAASTECSACATGAYAACAVIVCTDCEA